MLERAANGHDFAHRLHLGIQDGFGARKFFELPARNFDNDVIDGRFETGRRGARNVVLDFIEAVPDGELGGNFGDREACRFRRKSRTARDTRIHLDNHHAAVFGIDGKLHVRAARIDTDLVQTAQRSSACAIVEFRHAPFLVMIGDVERILLRPWTTVQAVRMENRLAHVAAFVSPGQSNFAHAGFTARMAMPPASSEMPAASASSILIKAHEREARPRGRTESADLLVAGHDGIPAIGANSSYDDRHYTAARAGAVINTGDRFLSDITALVEIDTGELIHVGFMGNVSP